MYDLAQVQISLDNNVKRSFSVLIHKSVENDMDQLICGAIWICALSHFIKSNYIAEKMDAGWLQKHCTKPCSAKKMQ